jgi:hypothetical protein
LPPITAEGRAYTWTWIDEKSWAFAVAIGGVGGLIWRLLKHFRGVGESLMAISIAVFVAIGLKLLQGWLMKYAWGRTLLRKMRVGK